LAGRQALIIRMRLARARTRAMKGNVMSPRVPALPPGQQATTIGRRTALLAGAALPLGLLAARVTPAAAQVTPAGGCKPKPLSTQLTLPAPTGHLRTGTVSLHLVDPSRPDPWVPSERVRELMIQLWYPAQAVDDYPRAPYTSAATASAWEKIQGLPALNLPIPVAHAGAPVHQRPGGWPVVLYSHALGGERWEATCLAEDLASRGYIVVTIDHVHDADVVVLPDGTVAFCEVPPPTVDAPTPTQTKEIVSRVADVSFVLDQLEVLTRGGNPDHEHQPLPHGLSGALDLRHTGMFGFSDGGSTTAHALNVEPRLTAGVNLDGTLWTPQAVAGSSRPLLLFGEATLDPFQAQTYAEFWTRQRGPKLWLNLKGSKHQTFTDFAALVPQVAPIICEDQSWVIQGVGTIGPRAVPVERAYIAAWFDQYLRHRDGDLLRGPSPCYPEVVFTRR
jgi:predicted dienelactone hydrolase